MKAVAAALLLVAGVAHADAGLTLSGMALNPPTVGGGGNNVTAAFDCRSFGQTAQDGGTLNIKYATPVMCWASRSTVSSTAVNAAGWVPETWFEWNWDDSSLGTVSRGGVTVDLGESIGLVAAHAFKPSTYAETCGGGTNSLHTVTLTVYSVVSGALESDSATMNVCVEDPATTWPTPVAYCDDADCSNDTFSNVVNPGTPSHGGNGTDLATILNSCDATSRRILLEGGVTFSTASTGVTMGGASCLIESYGTGNSKLRFTATSSGVHAILANDATGAGVRFNDVTLAGGGAGTVSVIAGAATGGTADRGRYVIIDSDVSAVAGEEFGSLINVNPAGAGVQEEGYYFKFTFDTQVANLTQAYVHCNYCAFVGGEISGLTQDNNNNFRLAQGNYLVIDAMQFADTSSHVITLRQDCGGTTSCPNQPSGSVMAVTRSRLLGGAGATVATVALQIGKSGSGDEQTKMYDIDILRNVFTYTDSTAGIQDMVDLVGGGSAGTELDRIRVFQNAADIGGSDRTSRKFVNSGASDDTAFIGNVVVNTGAFTDAVVLTNGSSSVIDVAKNNACYDVNGNCNIFSGLSESADNVSVGSNPFTVTPDEFASFDFTDVTIGNGSAFDDTGVLPPYPTDVAGTTCVSGYDVGPYCTP